MQLKILFVCLGNICRSPMAEGIFKHFVEREGLSASFQIDSAGTAGFHVGAPPDARMRDVAMSHGVKLTSSARQFLPEDHDRFDFILAMDHQNLEDIEMAGTGKAQVQLMRDYDVTPEDGNVPDPYYGGVEGFENVYQILERSSKSLLTELRRKYEI